MPLAFNISEALDELAAARAVYQSFMKDEDLLGQVKEISARGIEALRRRDTTEFENWCCRLLWQCGGTKAKGPCAALTKKHAEYVESVSSIPGGGKNNPSKLVFPALWAFAKTLVGGKDTKEDAKKAEATSEAPAAKRTQAPVAKAKKGR